MKGAMSVFKTTFLYTDTIQLQYHLLEKDDPFSLELPLCLYQRSFVYIFLVHFWHLNFNPLVGVSLLKAILHCLDYGHLERG